MHLHQKDDEVLVWFNRKVEPVVAHLPDGKWSVGLLSDETAEVAFTDHTATLTPRSVLALVRSKTP